MNNKIFFTVALFGLYATAFSQKVGIGTSTPNNLLEVVAAPPTSTNSCINVTNTGATGAAIVAENIGMNNGNAIACYSIKGTAMQAFTNSGTALRATSIGSASTALTASSYQGTALTSDGKIRIFGGNTHPSDGALLTCDPFGNATWEVKNLAFSANSAVNIGLQPTILYKVDFTNEVYDTHNCFTPYTGTANPNSGYFTAPIAGVYHFNANVKLENSLSPYDYTFLTGVSLESPTGVKYAKTAASAVRHSNGNNPNITTTSNYWYLHIDADIHLSVGQSVAVKVIAYSAPSQGVDIAKTDTAPYSCIFSGELLFAD